MGRKIPGRKHHGVRDPEKQHMQRELLLKDKVNAPPTNPDDQQIPNSLRRIIELKDKVKSGAFSLKRKRRNKKNKPVSSHPFGVQAPRNGEKPTPVFTQEKDETDRSFMFRVRKICNSVMKEAEFENKYRVNVKRNAFTGEVEDIVKRDKDELEVYAKQVMKDQKMKGKKKKKKKETDEPKLSKSQKRGLKLKEKKEKHKLLNEDRFSHLKDNVAFGETVHEPPTLVAPRRVTKSETARPGKKDLLLKTLMNGKTSAEKIDKPTIGNAHNKTENRVIDRKGKRKDLPNALRRQLDKQQEEVIQAYKLLKAKKYNT